MKLPAVTWFLLLQAATAHAADLGRLFYTPEQRKALDAARAPSSQPTKPPGPKAAEKGRPARLDGYVARSDGVSTVWLDGRAVRSAAKTK